MDELRIEQIICKGKRIEIAEEQYRIIDQSFDFLSEYRKDKVIYGINTGFGPMAQFLIDNDDLNKLQYNIIRSHSCGAGKPINRENIRGAMLSRLCTFVAGKSAVHRDTVDILKDFLNNDIIPFVPEHGSVGASGDLVQLSHIALTLIGEGEVFFKGELMKTTEEIGRAHV